MKRITRFNPAGDRDAAERHYTEAHHPFMRRLFRDHGELVVRYVANRALAQYDLAGGFRERPDAWRFVITEVGDAAGAAGFLPARFQPLIWEDHREEQAPFMRDRLARAYGARVYVSNRVLREAETTDEFGPGAAYAGTYRAAPQLVAVGELWFDNDGWAEEFFAAPAVLAELRDGALGRVAAYRVAETIGVDKR